MLKLENKLENLVRVTNLVLTNTIEYIDCGRYGIDYKNLEIDYNECTSLYDILSKFSKMYLTFKKNCVELRPLGKYVNFERFNGAYDEKGNPCHLLALSIEKPSFVDYDYAMLYIWLYSQNNIDSRRRITSGGSFINDRLFYYCQNIDAKNDITQKYADIFKEQISFLDLYACMQEEFIFNNDDCTLSIKTDDSGDILDDINSFSIALFVKPDIEIKLTVNLEDLSIDLENSSLYINDKSITLNKNLCMCFLKSIYVNNNYLKTQLPKVEKEDMYRLALPNDQ